MYKDVLLNTCGSAPSDSTWCFCQWTLRYSFLPMLGEERLGGRVCLDWWNLRVPRTCRETARKSNAGKIVLSFGILLAKFNSLLFIFWCSQDLRLRNTGETRVYAGHLVFAWPILRITVEPRFNEVAGDRPNVFVKSRVRCIENLDITNTPIPEKNRKLHGNEA